ncbi:MAG: hypothetical protein O2856_02215 [Planctomycetota bacterium]|nr:hypothetical protein [Planctomycetota bacterium]
MRVLKELYCHRGRLTQLLKSFCIDHFQTDMGWIYEQAEAATWQTNLFAHGEIDLVHPIVSTD